MFVVANASTEEQRELFEGEVPLREVNEWLREFELLDDRTSELERRERYSRLCKTEFGLVPKADWKYYYRDLLEVE